MRSELHFRIEENASFRMKPKLASKYPFHHHSDGPWMVRGYNVWSSSSELPHNVSPREFHIFLTMLSVNNPNAGSTIMNFFNELEVVPAYETGNDSWIKKAVPKWYDFLMKKEKILRNHDLRKVHET